MLTLKTINAGRLTAVVALLALITLELRIGAVAAHAQGVCYEVPLHRANWYPTPFGGYWGACLHFVTRCY
jgi:hypothetical protein